MRNYALHVLHEWIFKKGVCGEREHGVYALKYVIFDLFTLKMLGLYLYTLIIGHKSCNMLSILYK